MSSFKLNYIFKNPEYNSVYNLGLAESINPVLKTEGEYVSTAPHGSSK
jgi:hypothetical protein